MKIDSDSVPGSSSHLRVLDERVLALTIRGQQREVRLRVTGPVEITDLGPAAAAREYAKQLPAVCGHRRVRLVAEGSLFAVVAQRQAREAKSTNAIVQPEAVTGERHSRRCDIAMGPQPEGKRNVVGVHAQIGNQNDVEAERESIQAGRLASELREELRFGRVPLADDFCNRPFAPADDLAVGVGVARGHDVGVAELLEQVQVGGHCASGAINSQARHVSNDIEHIPFGCRRNRACPARGVGPAE